MTNDYGVKHKRYSLPNDEEEEGIDNMVPRPLRDEVSERTSLKLHAEIEAFERDEDETYSPSTRHYHNPYEEHHTITHLSQHKKVSK